MFKKILVVTGIALLAVVIERKTGIFGKVLSKIGL